MTDEEIVRASSHYWSITEYSIGIWGYCTTTQDTQIRKSYGAADSREDAFKRIREIVEEWAGTNPLDSTLCG
jgi:hypothetical protein